MRFSRPIQRLVDAAERERTKRPGRMPQVRKSLLLTPQQKVRYVLGEFKRGTLRSGSGARVTSRRQAIAIAMSEAGLSRKGRRRRS